MSNSKNQSKNQSQNKNKSQQCDNCKEHVKMQNEKGKEQPKSKEQLYDF